jgi:DNA-binding IclR family transcriptional regulator
MGGEPERAQLVPLVLGTLMETFGECLSLAEATRLFGLRESTCRVVLDHLVAEKRLRRTRDGRYTIA